MNFDYNKWMMKIHKSLGYAQGGGAPVVLSIPIFSGHLANGIGIYLPIEQLWQDKKGGAEKTKELSRN